MIERWSLFLTATKIKKCMIRAVNNYYPYAFLVYKAIVNLVAFTKF